MDNEKSIPLVPWSDKVSRDRSEHPDRIPLERKTPHPVTRRVAAAARSNRPR